MRLALKERKPFCLAVSPAKQKMPSLGPRRLCGENSILDKHDIVRRINLSLKSPLLIAPENLVPNLAGFQGAEEDHSLGTEKSVKDLLIYHHACPK